MLASTYKHLPKVEHLFPKNFSLQEMLSGGLNKTSDYIYEVDENGIARVEYVAMLAHYLQALRDIVGVPIFVTSGIRTPAHNTSVNGAAESYHLRGKAVDIQSKKLDMLFTLTNNFYGGRGSYKGFIHLDLGNRRRWSSVE